MKKLGIVLGLVLLGVTSLFADYQLTLIDKNGTETKQCIKSYSFSNNLESLARKNNVGLKDVYSEEEVMTNKVYKGKPIYRKIVTIPDLTPTYDWVTTSYLNPPKNIDTFISANFVGVDYSAVDRGANTVWKLHYQLGGTTISYTFGTSRQGMIEKRDAIVEYTKTTDEANSASNTFKSYLIYVPSASEDEKTTTIELEDTGVKILKNYTYNLETDSCTTN